VGSVIPGIAAYDGAPSGAPDGGLLQMHASAKCDISASGSRRWSASPTAASVSFAIPSAVAWPARGTLQRLAGNADKRKSSYALN
jgi:hypothetical protein